MAAKVLLNPEAWEVTYGKSGAEGARREVVALRPVQAPQTARALLVLQSGLTIHLKLLAHTKPGMLSVTWDIPALTPVTSASAPLPVDQRPPQFDSAHAYAGYTLEADDNPTRRPPWLPEAVLDDGRNTLLKFRGTLDGVRVPVVSGVQQNGSLALVHSRWYVRPEHGAWLYRPGLCIPRCTSRTRKDCVCGWCVRYHLPPLRSVGHAHDQGWTGPTAWAGLLVRDTPSHASPARMADACTC